MKRGRVIEYRGAKPKSHRCRLPWLRWPNRLRLVVMLLGALYAIAFSWVNYKWGYADGEHHMRSHLISPTTIHSDGRLPGVNLSRDFARLAVVRPVPLATPQPRQAVGATRSGELVGLHAAGSPTVRQWERVAWCETRDRWDAHTGNGYEGGLQFDPRTWTSMDGTRFAARAWQATEAQQIAVANATLAASSWKQQWPACSLRMGMR